MGYNQYKVYVNVNAEFTASGEVIPKSVIWIDGVTYEINRIIDVRRAACLRAGGRGIRFTCIIDGNEKHLYYEDGKKWFVESA